MSIQSSVLEASGLPNGSNDVRGASKLGIVSYSISHNRFYRPLLE